MSGVGVVGGKKKRDTDSVRLWAQEKRSERKELRKFCRRMVSICEAVRARRASSFDYGSGPESRRLVRAVGKPQLITKSSSPAGWLRACKLSRNPVLGSQTSSAVVEGRRRQSGVDEAARTLQQGCGEHGGWGC